MSPGRLTFELRPRGEPHSPTRSRPLPVEMSSGIQSCRGPAGGVARTACSTSEPAPNRLRRSATPGIVIVGARNMLGRAFAQICSDRGLASHLVDEDEMDLTNVSAA